MFAYFFFAGGTSVQLPCATSAAMPISHSEISQLAFNIFIFILDEFENVYRKEIIHFEV